MKLINGRETPITQLITARAERDAALAELDALKALVRGLFAAAGNPRILDGDNFEKLVAAEAALREAVREDK